MPSPIQIDTEAVTAAGNQTLTIAQNSQNTLYQINTTFTQRSDDILPLVREIALAIDDFQTAFYSAYGDVVLKRHEIGDLLTKTVTASVKVDTITAEDIKDLEQALNNAPLNLDLEPQGNRKYSVYYQQPSSKI